MADRLDKIDIQNPDTLKKISKDFVKKNLILPFAENENSVKVVTDSTDKFPLLDNLSEIYMKPVEYYISDTQEINKVIDSYYYNAIETDSFTEEIQDEDQLTITTEIKETDDLLYRAASKEPIINFVNSVIIKAIKENSTDIHFESYEKKLTIRFRIDGVLYEKFNPAKEHQSAIITRIKILSNLNIAESRLPQDGRFQISFGGRKIDFRVSSIPTSHGERVVLRILDRTKHLLQLEHLGMNKQNYDIFLKKISSPNGIIFVTGPTGSGKTTTLYAALMTISRKEKNIMTIEDPIEYQISSISQMQAKESIGLTFAHGLRAILRQDPDIIMIGEVRDTETLTISINASLTGHLVFSTLHTNDAINSIVRLYNLGEQPYLISSTVIAIVAQRLVRKLCTECKTEIEFTEEMKNNLNMPEADEIKTCFKSNGCKECGFTGFSGRTGVYEILDIDDDIKDMIIKKEPMTKIKTVCEQKGFKFLINDALDKFKQGLTSYEEILSLKQK